MKTSTQQKVVDELMLAAEKHMNQVIKEEVKHGKPYNFILLCDKEIWVFEDGYKLEITKNNQLIQKST